MRIIMKTLNNFHNKYKNMVRNITTGIIALCFLLTACSPQEDDSYKLGGSQVEIPQNLKITAVDNDNEVVITFDAMTIIDGDDVLAVQFSSAEAGINFTVKDASTTVLKKKVYRSGEYTLYVAAITRAGTGTPREIPFTVAKNLLLETLSESILPEVVKYDIDATHQETFYKNELYIEKNSIITLAGAIGNEDVIVNLDFFERENATSAKFIGESGVYSIYWNPVRKNVIIEPTIAIEAPNYYVFTGVGIGYPTTVSSEDIKAAYGAGDGRYTTEWDPGKNIRSRVVMRSTGENTYQATICINEGAAFKPFSNTGWAGEIKTAAATFTGSDIIDKKKDNDWVPNGNLDKNAYYRITVNSSTKAVDIKKVSATGEVLPDDTEEGGNTGIDPNIPFVSDKFDLVSHSTSGRIKDEVYKIMFYSLEKGAEYTLEGGLAEENIIYNVDFFERVSATKVKFLGETGNYRLYYNPIRRYVIVGVAEPRFPAYLVACGIGLGYPTKISSEIIGTYYKGKDWYSSDWNVDDVMRFILFRNITAKKYQATVFIAPDQASFKPFENTANWWDGGKNFNTLNFTGEAVLQSVGDDHNWGSASALVAGQPYRITIDLDNNSVNISKFTLPQ